MNKVVMIYILSLLITGILSLLITGCSWFQDNPIDSIKDAQPSVKEEKILFQVDHFLNSEYEVIGYEINDRYRYNYSVEVTLKEVNGGRTMIINLEWDM